MKTFHEWLVEQRQCEGLWPNDKNAVIGLSKLYPLPRDSAVNKNLTKKPAKAATPTVQPFKPAQPAKLRPFKAKPVGKVGVAPATPKPRQAKPQRPFGSGRIIQGHSGNL